MDNFRRPERHELDFNFFLKITRLNLEKCYKNQTPEPEQCDFNLEVLNVVDLHDDPAIEGPVEIISQFVPEELKKNGNDWIARSPHGPIIISSAYLSRARKAMNEADPDTAWSYLADTMYWCGISVSGLSIDELLKKTVVNTKKSLAKSGGKAKDEKYEPLRQYLFQLVRDKKPASGWTSRSHAVRSVLKDAQSFSQEGTPKLVEESSKTIDKWLAMMPDAASLFPIRERKRKK